MLLPAAFAGCLAHAHDEEAVATTVVTIPGPWVFEPFTALVTVGDTVTFRNDGGADHTVTFEAIHFDVTLDPGGSATYTFDAPGTFHYVCKYHPPDMTGTILVQAKEI